MKQSKQSPYKHAKVAKNIYQRGKTFFYVRILEGKTKEGKKVYLQRKLPCKTADQALIFGNALLERFHERKNKEAVEAFLSENKLKLN